MTFKPQHHPEHLYFITATILGWKPLFLQQPYAAIVLDSLTWHCTQARWLLFAYVLMPHHLHALLKPCAPYTISQVLQSFGSFTAHAILQQLQAAPISPIYTSSPGGRTRTRVNVTKSGSRFRQKMSTRNPFCDRS
jgi:REP element-mobilizing transposase RayT